LRKKKTFLWVNWRLEALGEAVSGAKRDELRANNGWAWDQVPG